jgi:hypothetical protein
MTSTISGESSYLITIPSSSSSSWSSSGRKLVGWSFRASPLGEEVKKVTPTAVLVASKSRAKDDDDRLGHHPVCSRGFISKSLGSAPAGRKLV